MGKIILSIAGIIIAVIVAAVAIKYAWKMILRFVDWFCGKTLCVMGAGAVLFLTGAVLLFWEKYRAQGLQVLLWAVVILAATAARRIMLKKYGIVDCIAEMSTTTSFFYLIGIVFLALGAIGAIFGIVGVERIIRVSYEEACMAGRIVSENPLRIFKNSDFVLANLGYFFVQKFAIAFGFISIALAANLLDMFGENEAADSTGSVVCWLAGALVAAILLTKPLLSMVHADAGWMHVLGMFISLFALLVLFVQLPRKAMGRPLWLSPVLAIGAVVISAYCACGVFWYIVGAIVLVVLYIGIQIFAGPAAALNEVVEDRKEYRKKEIENLARADVSRVSDYDLHWYYTEYRNTADPMDYSWSQVREEYERRRD